MSAQHQVSQQVSAVPTVRVFRYYDLVMSAFVTTLLCANVIGVGKICSLPSWSLGPLRIPEFTFGAGNLFFPISYVFGDVLTEVYGYARARRVIWAGFAALCFASMMSAIILALPAAAGWPHQGAYEIAFGNVWRVTLSSLVAFWVGDFVNSYVLAKMKVATSGKWLWTRTIGSTIVGQAFDTLIFYPLAFYGVWSDAQLVSVMIGNYLIKVGWEVVATPVTYQVVGFLKRGEGQDHFDDGTDFNPFTLKTE